jgi:hypothetical protein
MSDFFEQFDHANAREEAEKSGDPDKIIPHLNNELAGREEESIAWDAWDMRREQVKEIQERLDCDQGYAERVLDMYLGLRL